MREVERVRHFGSDPERLLQGQTAAPIEATSERVTLDVGHHEVEKPVGGPGVVEGQDVGVRQLRDDFDLSEKALRSEARNQVGPEDLQSHLAVMPHIIGQVDRGHPALTELTLDGVATLEGCIQAGNRISHGCKMRLTCTSPQAYYGV